MLLLFLFLLMYVPLLQAQDLIVLLKGDTLVESIMEIHETDIFYKSAGSPDSLRNLSTSTIRKIIFKNGTVKTIDHLRQESNTKSDPNDSKQLTVKGNTYFYDGWRVSYEYLEKIYSPLHDDSLNTTYYKSMNLKKSSATLSYLPIPLGAVGGILYITSVIPTNYIFSDEPKYGHADLALPGALFLGSALASGVGGILMHRVYKVYLKQSAMRYNKLISKYGLE